PICEPGYPAQLPASGRGALGSPPRRKPPPVSRATVWYTWSAYSGGRARERSDSGAARETSAADPRKIPPRGLTAAAVYPSLRSDSESEASTPRTSPAERCGVTLAFQ